MNPKDLLDLAERCEREGPNHELASAILVASGHQTIYRGAALGWEYRPDGKGIWRSMPRPDLSLDAAVTLEPADAQEICVRSYPNGGRYVRITLANGRPVYCGSVGAKITEAQARCAASLRARAAMEGENG